MSLSIEYILHKLNQIIIGETVFRFIFEVVEGILQITQGGSVVVGIHIG